MDWTRLASDWLRALRGKRSQVAFSRRLGYRSNVCHTWETSRRFPTAAETFRAASVAGCDVPAALARFRKVDAPWLRASSSGDPALVAALLEDLRGDRSVVSVARASGLSRFAIARFLAGDAQPRLPVFLELVQALSHRALDLIATTVDPSALPAATAEWSAVCALRRLAYDHPWSEAILRVLELDEYRGPPAHDDAWIAGRLDIDEAATAACIDAMLAAGAIARDDAGRLRLERSRSVDTGHDLDAVRELKSFWARVGLERLEARAPDFFSYRVFSVDEEAYQRVRDLHVEYYERLLAIVRDCDGAERIAVSNLQLFTLERPE